MPSFFPSFAREMRVKLCKHYVRAPKLGKGCFWTEASHDNPSTITTTSKQDKVFAEDSESSFNLSINTFHVIGLSTCELSQTKENHLILYDGSFDFH